MVRTVFGIGTVVALCLVVACNNNVDELQEGDRSVIEGEYQMILTVVPEDAAFSAAEAEAVAIAAMTRLVLRHDQTYQRRTGAGNSFLTDEGRWERQGSRVVLRTQKVINPDGSLPKPHGPPEAPWGRPQVLLFLASHSILVPADSIGTDGIAESYYLRLPPREALRVGRERR